MQLRAIEGSTEMLCQKPPGIEVQGFATFEAYTCW